MRKDRSVPSLHAGFALVSEQYAPDLSSSAQLLTELSLALANAGMEVRVCAIQPGYVKGVARAPWREVREGVRVARLPRLPFARTNRFGEALNWLWTTICLTWLALWVPRRLPLLVSTNPPMAHVVGALMKILKGQRFVALFYDLHPELSCAVGVLRPGSLVDRWWRRLNTWVLKQADVAICLGRFMEAAVQARLSGAPTTIIHNWCDSRVVRCLPKSESRFAREHGLLDTFVVMFSGNIGWRQRLEILLEVAAEMQDEPIRFVFIGEGAKKSRLQEKARERGLRNVLFFPYQPRELMEHSLAAADLAVASQEREVVGCGVPSKTYTYMASGRPILALASRPCELIDLMNETKCGWFFDEDHDKDAIVAKLRELLHHPERAREAGRRARREFEARFSLEIIAGEYAQLLHEQYVAGPAPQLFARLLHNLGLRRAQAEEEARWAALRRELLRRQMLARPRAMPETVRDTVEDTAR